MEPVVAASLLAFVYVVQKYYQKHAVKYFDKKFKSILRKLVSKINIRRTMGKSEKAD